MHAGGGAGACMPPLPPPLPSGLVTPACHPAVSPPQVVTNSLANETYVLTQCGVAPPPAADFPAGTKFFTAPLTALSAPETVPYAFVVRGAGCWAVGRGTPSCRPL